MHIYKMHETFNLSKISKRNNVSNQNQYLKKKKEKYVRKQNQYFEKENKNIIIHDVN